MQTELCLHAGVQDYHPEAFNWMLCDKGKLFLMFVWAVWFGGYFPACFTSEEQGIAGLG